MSDIDIALAMLRAEPSYIEDARTYAPRGNSVVGSMMSLVHRIPRQYAEVAVLAALDILDAEADGGAS